MPVWQPAQLQGTALQGSPHSKAAPTVPAPLPCRSALMPPAGRPSSPARFQSCPGTARPCPRCSWLVRHLTFIAGGGVQNIHDRTGIVKSVQATPGCMGGGYKSRLWWPCLRYQTREQRGAHTLLLGIPACALLPAEAASCDLPSALSTHLYPSRLPSTLTQLDPCSGQPSAGLPNSSAASVSCT